MSEPTTLTRIELDFHPGLPPDGAEGTWIGVSRETNPHLFWWDRDRAPAGWTVVGRDIDDHSWTVRGLDRAAVLHSEVIVSHAKVPDRRAA